MMRMIMKEFLQWKQQLDLRKYLEEKHPLAGLFLFQIMIGVLMVGAVSAVAIIGELVIWVFFG